MKKKMFFILVLFAFLGTFSTNAQIRGIMRDRVREALRDQPETETKEDEDENKSQKETPASPSPFEIRMGDKIKHAMGVVNLDFEDQYKFNSNMIMDIDSYDSEEQKHSSIKYTMYFNDDHDNFAMQFRGEDTETGEDQQSLLIFDMKNHVMLILSQSEDQKSGMAFSTLSDSLANDEQDTEIKAQDDIEYFNLNYKKTGRSKTISGYLCDEYVMEDENMRAEYWISTDAQFDYSKAYQYMSGVQVMTGGTAGFNGIIMEYNFSDKDTKDWVKMAVNEVNPNKHTTFDITGYSIIGLAGAPGNFK